jgi:hypothetical protein
MSVCEITRTSSLGFNSRRLHHLSSRIQSLPWWILFLLHCEIFARDVDIVSFTCSATELIFRAEVSRRFPPSIQRNARRKLLAFMRPLSCGTWPCRRAIGSRP